MKKSLLAVLLMMGVGSAAAAVTPTAFTGNVSVDNAKCALLANPVTLGVSAKVHGAYGCDEATNTIKVGACHEGGSREATDNCAQTGGLSTTTDTSDDTYNYSWCNATNVGTIPTSVGVVNYTAYVVGSQGGSVAGVDLGGRCSDSTITGVTYWSQQ